MAIGGSRIRVDTGPLKNPANFAQTIDIVPLFSGDGGARGAAVRGLGRALQEDGVFVAPRLPEGAQLERRAASLLAFFDLSEADKLRLATRRVRADSRRSYRGYVSTLKQGWAYNEFFDIGPERALPPPAIEAAQIFAETNIWPARPPFPRWRAEMLAYHGAMDSAGAAILATAGEFLGLSESALAPLFAGGGSTLRLLNYPRKPGGAVITEEMPHPDGARLVTGRHVDACALTLLWQRQAGLQAQTPDGRWLDIACRPGAISVHLGSVMEFLTAGHWRATPHRVLDNGMARGAIGYFHEPNLDAELAPQISPKIAPPPEQSRQTARLTYGAHLLQRFSRYGGLEHLRARACQVRLRSPDTL